MEDAPFDHKTERANHDQRAGCRVNEMVEPRKGNDGVKAREKNGWDKV